MGRYDNADKDPNHVDPGQYVTTLVKVEAVKTKDAKPKVLFKLGYKVLAVDNQPFVGVVKEELFQITGASQMNRHFLFRRVNEGFGISLEEMKAGPGMAQTDEQEVGALIRLIKPKLGRKVVMTTELSKPDKQQRRWVNIKAGRDGIRPYVENEEFTTQSGDLDGLGEFAPAVTNVGNEDPFAEPNTSGSSEDPWDNSTPNTTPDWGDSLGDSDPEIHPTDPLAPSEPDGEAQEAPSEGTSASQEDAQGTSAAKTVDDMLHGI